MECSMPHAHTILLERGTEDEQPSQVQVIPSHAEFLVLQDHRNEETQATKPKHCSSYKVLQETIKPLLPSSHHSQAASIITAPILLHRPTREGSVPGEAAPLSSPSQPKGNRHPIPQRSPSSVTNVKEHRRFHRRRQVSRLATTPNSHKASINRRKMCAPDHNHKKRCMPELTKATE